MADDAARIAQLEAEVRQAREMQAATQARADALAERAARAEAHLAEALEGQTATSEILRVIASSPTNLPGVLQSIVVSAARLCAADQVYINLVEGDEAVRAASVLDDAIAPFPLGTRFKLAQAGSNVEAIKEQRTLTYVIERPAVSPDGIYRPRVIVAVPLRQSNESIGVLIVTRLQAHQLSEREISLLETFADQAVIAIENARLFEELAQRNGELTQALEQQTATAEVLRVIASSPTDLQAVLDTIAQTAARLCNVTDAVIYRREGDQARQVVSHGTMPSLLGVVVAVSRGLPSGRSMIERRTIHVLDLAAELDTEFPDARWIQERDNSRTVLATPLLRGGDAIGAILIRRPEVEPFTEREVALLETFADQAVIAIENARLFEELEQRTRDLSEALEQQTAQSEVLRVIAASPTDAQPVLDAVVQRAARLSGSLSAMLFLVEGTEARCVALDGRMSEMPVSRIGLSFSLLERRPFVHAINERRTIHIPDMSDPAIRTRYPDAGQSGSIARLFVPLIHEQNTLGVFLLSREAVRPYTPREIALLETFGDQAAIAVANARLFEALQQRTDELTRALEHQTAVSEVLRVIAASPTNLQQVLDALTVRATRLCNADSGSLFKVDGEEVVVIVSTDSWRAGARQPSAGTLTGHVLREARTIHVHGSRDEQLARYPESRAVRDGVGAQLGTPLLQSGQSIGAFVVGRYAARPFTAQEIGLLETFADQAVIAIENARLFEELREKSQALELASQHKSQFLANMSHELRTPLNAIIGYSEMLQEEAEEIGEQSFIPDLQKVNAAGKHLLGLINDILDLSKIEAGRMDLYPETFSVADLVRDVAAIAMPLVEKNGNRLEIACPPDIGPMHADQTKLRQTLFNLLSNAAKFTERGVIELRVASESRERTEGRVGG